MAKGGRPTKLTPETHERIVDLVKRGNYVETAAELCGVGRRTVKQWLALGRTQKTGRHRKFRHAVLEASCFAEASDVETIRKAATGDWRAAAWRLEHRFPQRWARKGKAKHEVTGKGGAPLSTPQAVIYLPDNGRLPGDTDEGE